MARKWCILGVVMFLSSCSAWKPRITLKITPGTVRNAVDMDEDSVNMIRVSLERDW